MPKKGKGEEAAAAAGGARAKRKPQHRGGPRQFTAEEDLEADDIHKRDGSSDEEREDKDEEAGNKEEEESTNKHKGPVQETENLNRDGERTAEHIKASQLDVNKKPQLNRKEREELEKQKRKKKYMEAYAQGRTAEAQQDLARLQRIRREREAAAKRKEEETQAKEEAKKAAREKGRSKTANYL